ncbi:MAG: hypothetical protein HOL37_09685 [Rhodospirillaceae bacterium]|jgi:glycosyltransferase 2 family protein|nr:hypothetical protein [Rhodospirillaceae bacterium]MBT5013607.1 hypothetical protein [Rhodospirillaceae bacterium]MBT5309594.1 hypothetical protein [Rhodospirillaceae bacterium]MBT7354920.1 hypothetical protein [Rhodospirillaceae bacterium]
MPDKMKILKVLYVGIGLALLTLVVAEVDVGVVLEHAVAVGSGMLVLLGLYFAAFVIDSFTWQMALIEVPLSPLWLYRTWKVRMVGEVFNNVMPAASMGGEPVKAVLMKRHYDIGYREGTASLILGKSINMIGLVIFLGLGFWLMLGSTQLPVAYKSIAGTGLAALSLGTFLFVVVQRLKLTSLTGTWISRWPFAARLESVLHHIHDMDERLVAFYTRYKARLVWAVLLAFLNWIIGVVEIYYMMIFLGNPMSWQDAWIIEAAVQLVRAGVFFIPAAIGAQEGVFLLIIGAMTGSPGLGASVAVVRRFREVLWLLWGTLLGAMFSLRRE